MEPTLGDSDNFMENGGVHFFMGDSMDLYSLQAKRIEGKNQKLSDYRGKVLLFVNVASKCGYTPQYIGLEQLYRKHHERGLEILAFPCNQFGSQEPGNETEIRQFCTISYEVSFPLFAKIEVNGPGENPIYTWLKEQDARIQGAEHDIIPVKWNFTKFLVNRKGELVKRYLHSIEPSEIEADIETLLKTP